MKKFIFVTALILGLLYYAINYTDRFDPFNIFREKYEYKDEFAILNKSFKRDLKRSANLYQSFEKYYVGAENIPFYIVVPESDLELFQDEFNSLKDENKIHRMPVFMTEREILEMCGEPTGILYNGNWTQQVVKLGFGMTNLARNYFSIDSDIYFTRKFDRHSELFKNDILKIFASKVKNNQLEKFKNDRLIWLDASSSDLSHSVYDHLTKIKDFFGNNVSGYYTFVYGGVLINSDVIHRMKKLMEKKGGYNFAFLIRLSPFEMQWYGEYVLQHEKFHKMRLGMFTAVNNPDECHMEPSGNLYGVWFQSVIYDYKTNKAAVDNDQIIYKMPSHCKIEK